MKLDDIRYKIYQQPHHRITKLFLMTEENSLEGAARYIQSLPDINDGIIGDIINNAELASFRGGNFWGQVIFVPDLSGAYVAGTKTQGLTLFEKFESLEKAIDYLS